MDYDNFDDRLKSAISSVFSQVKGGKGFGLAISNAASEFSIDRSFLAKSVQGKKKKKTKRPPNFIPKSVSPEWRAADERRYGWLDKD